MSMSQKGAEFLAVNIMLAMIPEEMLLDEAMKALTEYQQALNLNLPDPVKRPEDKVFALLMKWRSIGKSTEEIISQVSKVNDAHDYVSMMNGSSDNVN